MSDYVVRYIMEENGNPEDIPMDSLSDAYGYLDEHKNEQYYTLSIYDKKTNYILKIFETSLGEVREFEEGQEVKIREEWLDGGDEDLRYQVTNIHEDSGNCQIDCINSSLPFGSSEDVQLRMIEPV